MSSHDRARRASPTTSAAIPGTRFAGVGFLQRHAPGILGTAAALLLSACAGLGILQLLASLQAPVTIVTRVQHQDPRGHGLRATERVEVRLPDGRVVVSERRWSASPRQGSGHVRVVRAPTVLVW